ncbi:hypothetical protein [Microbacterium sp. G2-8]|uniref:hypothetical protein n=1 Tax=Microbacterium sp. G2-8 TaxID=2842454 RepID=UPI001C8A5765|nr:hypothetical protein [Microbacterium sp. G2-8]
MSGPEDLYPPVQYGALWLLIALAVLVAIAAGAWIVWALTRPPRIDAFLSPEPAPPTGTDLDRLRSHYLDRIGQIEAAYQAQAITAQHANAELSALTRAFVNEYTGLETPVLALDDLAERGVHPALIDALRRHYYPSLFRRGMVVDPVAGAEAARRVVTAWH